MRDLPETLTFAFVEGGTLQVFSDKAVAASEFEGIDVESGTVNFYDLDGSHLEPVFTTPNRQGKALGLIGWVASGSYDLVRSSDSAHDSIALALHEASLMGPNDFFSDLDQLRQVLRVRGVQVDFNRPAGSDEVS